MTKFTERIEIRARPAAIWDVMQKVESWKEWTTTITSIEKLDEGGVSIGTKLLIVQPNLPNSVWTVTDWIQQKRFIMKKGNAFLKVVAGHDIIKMKDYTMVELSIEFSGLFSRWVAKKYGAMMEHYLACEANGLKKICESVYEP